MGLLDQLWDDTLAGPRPDTGLGKLRKTNNKSNSNSSTTVVSGGLPVTRSITILRPKNLDTTGSLPSSPSSAPDSPFTPRTPRGDWRSFRRKPAAAEGQETAEPRSPTAYDWVVISALDR